MIKAPDVTLLYVMFAFVASYVLLKRFLFGPLGAILAEREREEREASQIHQESLKELERTIAEAERRLAEARRDALRTREGLRAEGLAKFETELARAKQSAATFIGSATGFFVRAAHAEFSGGNRHHRVFDRRAGNCVGVGLHLGFGFHVQFGQDQLVDTFDNFGFVGAGGIGGLGVRPRRDGDYDREA